MIGVGGNYMGVTFEPFRAAACCLCGSVENLTGEHKIKASALKAEFGDAKMVIGRVGDPNVRFRTAQSVKSKALHFGARLCGPCNSARTQAADREFDNFHEEARRLHTSGADPKDVFQIERYAVGSAPYLNVFRYFAKLMCCHMADSGAPRHSHMARFALGAADQNCIWLDVGEDWTYKTHLAATGPHQYAAHGGLVVYGHKRSGEATGFHSTLTIGPLRYVYFTRLNWIARLELRFGHKEFHRWCRGQVGEATVSPMSNEERLSLGFSIEDETTGNQG